MLVQFRSTDVDMSFYTHFDISVPMGAWNMHAHMHTHIMSIALFPGNNKKMPVDV